ncbi:MAG: MBL fold metallo-hydrolase [Treponemataceae bacterium]|nr:MBL fold metallo-hydrolase [Treponemataceae bacterium]
MKVTVFGSGTSTGIPTIGCRCRVCMSPDEKDKRHRASILATAGNGNNENIPAGTGNCSGTVIEGVAHTRAQLIVDTGPEFRIQALRHRLSYLDAVLLTHAHADHVHGLDDVRIFSNTVRPRHPDGSEWPPLCVYTNSNSIRDIRERFAYVFKQTQQGGGKPRLELKDAAAWSKDNPLIIRSQHFSAENGSDKNLENLACVPVPMKHGKLDVCGWLIGDAPLHKNRFLAYLTDCSYISDESLALAKGAEQLIIDGLRYRPHETHFSFDQALKAADKIGAKHVWLTHINHDASHEEINRYLTKAKKQYKSLAADEVTVEAAYDGLVLTV